MKKCNFWKREKWRGHILIIGMKINLRMTSLGRWLCIAGIWINQSRHFGRVPITWRCLTVGVGLRELYWPSSYHRAIDNELITSPRHSIANVYSTELYFTSILSVCILPSTNKKAWLFLYFGRYSIASGKLNWKLRVIMCSGLEKRELLINNDSTNV